MTYEFNYTMESYYEINNNILKYLTPIFHKQSGDIHHYNLNVNEMYNNKFHIAVEYFGDYEIKIFKIGDQINEYLLNNNDVTTYNIKSFFDKFCVVEVCTSKNKKCDINPLKNIYFNTICPYKVAFKKIFNKKWTDVIRWNIIYKDGNQYMCVLQFVDDNEYYVIKFLTS